MEAKPKAKTKIIRVTGAVMPRWAIPVYVVVSSDYPSNTGYIVRRGEWFYIVPDLHSEQVWEYQEVEV